MPFKSLRLSKRRKHSVRPLQRLFKYGHQYIKQIRLAIGASVLNKVFYHCPIRRKRYLWAIFDFILVDSDYLGIGVIV